MISHIRNEQHPSQVSDASSNENITSVDESLKLRGQWTREMDFVVSCLGYIIGLGNIWRFPYLCYKHGGGAFLIPYVLMLLLCGLPLFFLEIAIGQYHGKGPTILFKHIAPAFRGLGYAMVIISFFVSLYSNIIITWGIFYLFASFNKNLPWSSCGNEWNTPACYVSIDSTKCPDLTGINYTCTNKVCIADNGTSWSIINCLHLRQSTKWSASEEYYLHYVLGASSTIEEFGYIRWQLVLYLLCAWVIVALCLIKGIKSSRKVVYFTALSPFVVLLILLIGGSMLPGASEGIYYYIVPQWEKLVDVQAWGDAAVQIFYTFGLGFGGLLTLSSYNKFNNNCYRSWSCIYHIS